VIIFDFYIVRLVIFPDKTYAPLFIYTNTMLSFPLTFQFFQLIAGRNEKILDIPGSV